MARRAQISGVQGTAVKDGTLTSFPLPNASTAMEGDAAQICLRALTVALLCFFEPDTATHVLVASVPYGLLHYDQEGEDVKIEGPIYAAFRQYVKAVATEEDTDPIRQSLIRAVENNQARVSGASINEILSCNLLQTVDMPYSIGLVRWVLTSLHRRRHECYPTRSFTVWALATVLSELGFQVSASLWAVNNEDDYVAQISSSRYRTGHPDVVLVTASVGETDLMAVQPTAANPAVTYKPQVIPIRSIPWVAFQHLAGNDGTVNTQYLSDVWEYAFDQATRAVESPRLSMNVRIKPVPDHDLIYAEHKRLAAFWSFHIEAILRAPMQQFIPHHDGLSNLVDPCRKHFWHHPGLQHASELGDEAMDHWYVMTTIILATVYAVCCKSLRHDGKPAGAHTQVAFHSNFIYGPKVYDWAAVVGQALSGGVSSAEWIGMLLEMVAGVEHPKPLTDMSTNVLSRSWQIIPAGNASLEMTTVTDVFGAQSNGVVLVSDFLIKPTVRPEALILFHVQYGQILDLPTDNGGYIRAASVTRPVYPIPLSDDYRKFLGDGSPNLSIRIDVEPNWENDARLIVLRARNEGVLVATFSAELASRRIQYTTIPCRCGNPTAKIEVDTNEHWQTATVSQILSANGSRVSIGSNARVYICTAGNEMARLTCASLLECRQVGIVLDCMLCAHRNMVQRTGESSVIVG